MLKKIKDFLNKLSKKECEKQEFKVTQSELEHENFEEFKKAMINKETFTLK